MGKASRWFKALFGSKKSEQGQPKKRWSFAKSPKDKDRRKPQNGAVQGGRNDSDAGRHAVAVAEATAAVAEAAVAAAQAAAAVVKLTSRGGGGRNGGRYGSVEEWAAVTVQSHFRAYLSRRALRALKSLVKLQALVRGHISRKQAAEDLRRMKAIVRAQERARAGRVLVSEQKHSTTKYWSHSNHTSPTSQEKFEHTIQSRQVTMLKRNSSKSSGNVIYDQRSQELGIFPMDDERNDKILEVDTGKPHETSGRRITPPHSASTSKESKSPLQKRLLSTLSSGEVQSTSPLKYYDADIDVTSFFTAENSPQFYSASSMGGSSCSRRASPFNPPAKSDGSRSFLSSGYASHPSYMAYTESSKAKVRSLSAPKQRPQYERSSSANRYSVNEYGESRSNVQKISALMQSSFASKAYPGSGRLDRMGMPVRDVSGFSGEHWRRY